jgi:hypothetical protein
MMPKRPRPALVRWTDACDAAPEWTASAKVAASRPVACQSVGFLLAEDDERVVLATSISEDGDAANGIVIPTSCVTEVRYLDA